MKLYKTKSGKLYSVNGKIIKLYDNFTGGERMKLYRKRLGTLYSVIGRRVRYYDPYEGIWIGSCLRVSDLNCPEFKLIGNNFKLK